MRVAANERLSELFEEADKDYGKRVQKLLAIALLDAGADHVTERAIQGIDLEVGWLGATLALEVKTIDDLGGKGAVRLTRKDLEGLAAREAEGRIPHVAVLGRRLIGSWTVARVHAGELRAGQPYSALQLRAYRDAELEAALHEPFERAVLAHAAAALRGQKALDDVLRGRPGYHLA